MMGKFCVCQTETRDEDVKSLHFSGSTCGAESRRLGFLCGFSLSTTAEERFKSRETVTSLASCWSRAVQRIPHGSRSCCSCLPQTSPAAFVRLADCEMHADPYVIEDEAGVRRGEATSAPSCDDASRWFEAGPPNKS
jgi:hypothetical protein